MRLPPATRRWGLLVVALAGVAIFLREMHGHYPIDRWLFWIYARAWLLALVCGAACLCAGDLVVARLLRPWPPLRERLVLSFAVGVFVFSMGVFLAGLLHALGAVFYFAWPLALIVVAGPRLARVIRRALRLLPHAQKVAMRSSWWGGLALVFGLAGVALLYINILTPANVAYDARWYHLALAEHYVAAGAVTRFPEGWFCSTYPHLASFLYTWAFLTPDADLVAKIEIAAHIELVLFAVTLSGVSILAQWCAARANLRLRNAWAAMFLFPGILLYDSTLSVAADHALALFAPATFLLLRRVLRDWRVQTAALLGLIMAAALLTKYQAISFILVPSLVVVVKAVRRWQQRRAPGRWVSALPVPAVVASTVLVMTSSLWLTNWIWYGDPVYPMLRAFFPADPWMPGTNPGLLLQIEAWSPQGPFFHRVKETLAATLKFSFVAHDWWNHHGDLPIFGSLFTLVLPLLLFVRDRRRVVALAAATMAGLGIWYWTYHQDRYLQALLPMMAAVVAAGLAMAWTIGWTARIGIIALVCAQVIWGGDVYTIPTHGMIQTQPARLVLDLLSSGYRKDWAARKDPHIEYAPVAPLLPKGSTLLVHERMTHFGHGAKSVIDMPGTQAGISYRALATPRRVYELLRQFGTTHILWTRGSSQAFQSVVDDLVFFEFVEKYTTGQSDVAGFVLGQMPRWPPPEVSEPRVVRADLCGAPPRTVRLDQSDAALRGETFPDAAGQGAAAFYIRQSGCGSVPAEIASGYRRLLERGGFELFALK